MSDLTFKRFRFINLARAQEGFGHKDETLSDWSPTDWACALAGECGELCNLIKKHRRTDFSFLGSAETIAIGDEIADVQIYLDLTAARYGLNLDDLTIRKFNIVSQRVGAKQRL